jgi:Tfp pilus assembly protein PilN
MTVGIGIELGSSGLQAVVLEREGARLVLRASHELACDTANPDGLARGFAELRRLLRHTGPTVLGVPSTSAILATVSPLVPIPERAALAVQFELQQLLPFDLADAAWHYRWVSGNGRAEPKAPSRGGSSQAIVAAMRRSLLEERLESCRRAGFAVKAVAVTPIAALNAWDASRTSPASSRGATLLLLHDERSGEWVVRAGSSVQVVSVSGAAAEPFLQELAASWEALRTQPEAVPTPVWAAGPPDLINRLASGPQRLEAPVQPVELSRIVQSGGSPGGRGLAAVGLALQALDAAPVSLNLLASFQNEARGKRITRTAGILSAVFLVAAFAFGISGMLESRARKTRLLELLEGREKLYQTLRPEIRTMLRRQQRIEQRGTQLQRLATDASLLTRLLGELAGTLPDRVWLTSLEATKNGLLSGILEGRATSFQDVTQFFDRLKTGAGMTTVKPIATNVKTDEATGKEVIAFSVQIQRPLIAQEEPPSAEGSRLEVGGKSVTPRTSNLEPRTR